MYSIKCDFCKKENEFTEDKLNNNKKVKIMYCQKCGRSICLEHNGEKYYEEIDI